MTRHMRPLSILILIVTFFSCRINDDKAKSLNYYNQGIKAIGQVNTIGKIDYSKALTFFDESFRLNPEFIESGYWKSQCETHLGQLDKALETSESVINNEYHTNHKLIPAFYITAGLLQKIKGNSSQAIAYLKKATEIYSLRIEKNNNDTDAIVNKAIVLCYMDSKNEALDFLNSIAVNDENSNILEQIRENISTFDSDNLLQEIKNIRR